VFVLVGWLDVVAATAVGQVSWVVVALWWFFRNLKQKTINGQRALVGWLNLEFENNNMLKE
jgi:hypothetical protein